MCCLPAIPDLGHTFKFAINTMLSTMIAYFHNMVQSVAVYYEMVYVKSHFIDDGVFAFHATIFYE